MTGFIWILKKIRHLIKSSKRKIIFLTNHSAIINIAKQRLIINIISIIRNNLKHVKTFQFWYQFFNLNIRHKFGKKNIIPNALPKFVNFNIFIFVLFPDYDEFEVLYHERFFEINFTFTMTQMNLEFKKRIFKNIPKIHDETNYYYKYSKTKFTTRTSQTFFCFRINIILN